MKLQMKMILFMTFVACVMAKITEIKNKTESTDVADIDYIKDADADYRPIEEADYRPVEEELKPKPKPIEDADFRSVEEEPIVEESKPKPIEESKPIDIPKNKTLYENTTLFENKTIENNKYEYEYEKSSAEIMTLFLTFLPFFIKV